MDDPRAENCRGHRAVDGKVTGVELVHRVAPDSRYELRRVELIDEAAAQGNTVATCVVLDADGVPVAERVWLAWPWPTPEKWVLPGNPDNKHMITSMYSPPAIGPLCLYVGDADGNPLSDMIGGLGLPFGHHVSFRATWQVRRGDEEPEIGQVTDNLGRIADALDELCVWLARLTYHFGA